jgi:hypothetical protein
MPITICWDNEEKTIIRCLLEGIWNWNELIDQHAKTQSMFADVGCPTAIIIDMSESNYVPSGSSTHFKLLLKDFYPQTERVVFVGANNYFQKLISFHARSTDNFPLEIQHTPDLESARALCASPDDRSSSDTATTC